MIEAQDIFSSAQQKVSNFDLNFNQDYFHRTLVLGWFLGFDAVSFLLGDVTAP